MQREFKAQYPMLLRRHEFFQLRQAKGQSLSDFAVKLRELGDRADLDGLTLDQIYVFRYIGGTEDKRLREKFLRETDPTFESLRAVARAHEIANRGNASLDKKEAINQVGAKRQPGSKDQGQAGQRTPPKCHRSATDVIRRDTSCQSAQGL